MPAWSLPLSDHRATSVDAQLADRIRQANVRLHDEKAAEFDREEIHMHKPHVQARTRELVAYVANQVDADQPTLLDVGCGTGNLSQKFQEYDFAVTGLDISEGMLAIYRQKLGDQVQTIHSDVDAYFASTDQRFDVVSFSAALHHLPDYRASVAAAAAHLNPGGALVIHHEHRHAQAIGFWTRLAEKLDIHLYGAAYKWQHHRGDFWAAIGRKLGRGGKGTQAKRSGDIRLADYHVFAGGVDEQAVVETLRNAGMTVVRHDQYQELRLGWLNTLANDLSLYGLFSLVAVKPR